MSTKKLVPRDNHDHYWIEENTVYESYLTLRGLRYISVAEVISEDKEKLSEQDIEVVNNILKSN